MTLIHLGSIKKLKILHLKKNLKFIEIFNIFKPHNCEDFKKSHHFKICNNISLPINHGLWNWPRSQTRKKLKTA